MTEPKTIRILIVDDHPVVREGLSAMINRQPDMAVIAEAGDGQEALRLFSRERPDVTLMDLRMPGMSGVQTTEAITKEFPGSCIIVLTTYDADEDIYRALLAGAKAYLRKDTFREELLSSIRAVHHGRRRISSTIASRFVERASMPSLTPREMEVLKLIAKGESNKAIGSLLKISEGTVKFHVNGIMGKLGARDRTEAAITAVRKGIVSLD